MLRRERTKPGRRAAGDPARPSSASGRGTFRDPQADVDREPNRQCRGAIHVRSPGAAPPSAGKVANNCQIEPATKLLTVGPEASNRGLPSSVIRAKTRPAPFCSAVARPTQEAMIRPRARDNRRAADSRVASPRSRRGNAPPRLARAAPRGLPSKCLSLEGRRSAPVIKYEWLPGRSDGILLPKECGNSRSSKGTFGGDRRRGCFQSLPTDRWMRVEPSPRDRSERGNHGRGTTLLATAVATLLAAAAAQGQEVVTKDLGEAPTRVDGLHLQLHGLEHQVVPQCQRQLGEFAVARQYRAHSLGASAIEGYILCVNGALKAYDNATRKVVLAATVIAAPTATGITIRRKTLDGLFQLDQKWSRDNTSVT